MVVEANTKRETPFHRFITLPSDEACGWLDIYSTMAVNYRAPFSQLPMILPGKSFCQTLENHDLSLLPFPLPSRAEASDFPDRSICANARIFRDAIDHEMGTNILQHCRELEFTAACHHMLMVRSLDSFKSYTQHNQVDHRFCMNASMCSFKVRDKAKLWPRNSYQHPLVAFVACRHHVHPPPAVFFVLVDCNLNSLCAVGCHAHHSLHCMAFPTGGFAISFRLARIGRKRKSRPNVCQEAVEQRLLLL